GASMGNSNSSPEAAWATSSALLLPIAPPEGLITSPFSSNFVHPSKEAPLSEGNSLIPQTSKKRGLPWVEIHSPCLCQNLNLLSLASTPRSIVNIWKPSVEGGRTPPGNPWAV